MSDEKIVCMECGCPATWLRKTQFAGDHPYCAACAEKEDDFGKSNPSYFFWEEVSAPAAAPEREHGTEVPKYEHQLSVLVGHVHRLRYDQVAKFYRLGALELRRQAEADQARGRKQLAQLLLQAAGTAEAQAEQFEMIWRLCAPHM